MKKLITFLIVLALTISAGLSSGCSRQPAMKRTTSIMNGFFKKYSKKYPESVLGQNHVKDIQVLHIEEIHKGLVAVYAILDLDGGIAVQTRFTIQKKPLAWRAVSWENMGIAMRGPAQ